MVRCPPYLINSLQVPSLPANFGVKKLLSGEPASPLVNDTMSVASGYSTVTGTVIGPSVIARLVISVKNSFVTVKDLQMFLQGFHWLIFDEHFYSAISGLVTRPPLLQF